jgi:serine/threonine protein kinase
MADASGSDRGSNARQPGSEGPGKARSGPQAPPPAEPTFVRSGVRPDADATNSAPSSFGEQTLMHAPAAKVEMPSIPGVQLERELGRGGMGVVYQGVQPFLDRKVAVKLLGERCESADYLARFRREAKLLAGMSHANIVTCYSSDITAEGRCYLVMEFVPGPNLHQWISKQGPLELRAALQVCRDVARALEYAHERNIIHRDVKCENVLLSPLEGPGAKNNSFPWVAKLTDLGLARSVVDSSEQMNLTVTGMVMGTPATMSPEQFDDPNKVDFRSDIYGLGCVMFQALTGRKAFPQSGISSIVVAKRDGIAPADVRALRAETPEDVAKLVSRMLAADRAARPQSYGEVIATCERCLAAPPPSPPAETVTLKPSAAPAPRSKTGVFVAAGVALAGVVGFVAWLALGGAPQQQDTDKTAQADGVDNKPDENKAVVAPPAELVARVAPPSSAREGARVELDGSASNPESLAGLRYEWKLLEGPADLQLQDIDKPRAWFTAPTARAPYKVRAQLVVSEGQRSSKASNVEIAVDAADDEPTVSIDGLAPVAERDTLDLVARATDGDSTELTYAWKQLGGPTVELTGADKSRAKFTAPPVDSETTLEFEVAVSDGANTVTRRASATVRPVNEPPVVKIDGPTSAEPGDSITLNANVEDPDGLTPKQFAWSVSGAPAHKLDAANAAKLSVELAENAADYELLFSVAVTDGELEAVRSNQRVLVKCDPALAPLKSGAELALLAGDDDAMPAGWTATGAALRFAHDPEHRLLVTCMSAEGAVERAAPRGRFVVRGELESQGSTRGCGVRLEWDAERAVAVRIDSNDPRGAGAGDEKTFLVAQALERRGGEWVASDAKPQRLGLASRDKRMSLALDWDGRELHCTWGPPESPAASTELVPLPARPRRIALFVDRGRVSLSDWKLVGR